VSPRASAPAGDAAGGSDAVGSAFFRLATAGAATVAGLLAPPSLYARVLLGLEPVGADVDDDEAGVLDADGSRRHSLVGTHAVPCPASCLICNIIPRCLRTTPGPLAVSTRAPSSILLGWAVTRSCACVSNSQYVGSGWNVAQQ
jgi:hypothetical protein